MSRRCNACKTELRHSELQLHYKVLRDLGLGPRRRPNANEDAIVADPFPRRLKSAIKSYGPHGPNYSISPHVALCVQCANSPYTDPCSTEVVDALHRAQNIALSRVMKLAEACTRNQTYRDRFFVDPVRDGTRSIWSQVIQFFRTEYDKVQTQVDTIQAKFDKAVEEAEFVHAIDSLLDLEYGPHNRRPSNAPWKCIPKARLSEFDVDKFRLVETH